MYQNLFNNNQESESHFDRFDFDRSINSSPDKLAYKPPAGQFDGFPGIDIQEEAMPASNRTKEIIHKLEDLLAKANTSTTFSEPRENKTKQIVAEVEEDVAIASG